jgi:hypothetical protein
MFVGTFMFMLMFAFLLRLLLCFACAHLPSILYPPPQLHMRVTQCCTFLPFFSLLPHCIKVSLAFSSVRTRSSLLLLLLLTKPLLCGVSVLPSFCPHHHITDGLQCWIIHSTNSFRLWPRVHFWPHAGSDCFFLSITTHFLSLFYSSLCCAGILCYHHDPPPCFSASSMEPPHLRPPQHQYQISNPIGGTFAYLYTASTQCEDVITSTRSHHYL